MRELWDWWCGVSRVLFPLTQAVAFFVGWYFLPKARPVPRFITSTIFGLYWLPLIAMIYFVQECYPEERRFFP